MLIDESLFARIRSRSYVCFDAVVRYLDVCRSWFDLFRSPVSPLPTVVIPWPFSLPLFFPLPLCFSLSPTKHASPTHHGSLVARRKCDDDGTRAHVNFDVAN